MIIAPNRSFVVVDDKRLPENRFYAWMEEISRLINSIDVLTTIIVDSTAADYTTTTSQLIAVTGPLTITLNPTPIDRETVIVFHDGADGDYINVTDGSDTDTLIVPGTVMVYTYFAALGRWVP